MPKQAVMHIYQHSFNIVSRVSFVKRFFSSKLGTLLKEIISAMGI